MKKLTLNAEPEVIELAKKMADRQGTSVSAMFGQFVKALAGKHGRRKLGPITRRASGIVRLPSKKTDRQLIEEALSERHGL